MIQRLCGQNFSRRIAALAWIAALCLYAVHAGAATGTTRQGGNWNDPNTWSLTRTGTITVASTSTAVTGVGTLFTTELAVNDIITDASDNLIGVVQSIISNTALTLVANSTEDAAGIAYAARKVPLATDTAIIADLAAAYTVTVTANAAATGMTFNAGVQGTTVLVNPGVSLAIKGDTVINAPLADNVTKLIDVGAGGSFAGSGQLLLIGGIGTNRIAQVILENSATTTVSVGTNLAGNAGGAFNSSALITFNGAGTLSIGGNFASGATLTPGSGTIVFNGAGAQSIGSYNSVGASNNFNNFTINKSGGTATLAGSILVNGNFSNSASAQFSAGTCANPTFNTVTFNGTMTQNLTGAGAGATFCRVVLNNAAGLNLANAESMTVTNQLTFVAGLITTNTNTVIMGVGTIVGAAGPPQNSFVAGFLSKTIPAGAPTVTFEIGSVVPAIEYAPLSLTFTGSGGGAAMVASTTAGNHPNIGTSALNPTEDVNRWWRLTGGPTYTSYNITFNYPASDVDAGANPSIFETQVFIAGVWRNTTAGTRTATSTQAIDVTAVGDFAVGQRILSTIGLFNAYENFTPVGDVTGVLSTKVTNIAFTITLVPINATGTAVNTAFAGPVLVSLVNSQNGVPPAGSSCGAWPVIQTLAVNPTFTGTGNDRLIVSFTASNAYPNVRVQITALPLGSATPACSTDNFAIRPAFLSNVSAMDFNWITALPQTYTLNNAGATGGVVHRAGQPFALNATGVDASNNIMSGYANPATGFSGSPTVRTLATVLPAGGANGALTTGAWLPSAPGVATTSTATYSEAGSFNLALQDQTFAAVDVADTSGNYSNAAPFGRWIAQSPATVQVGRFVPDSFTLAINGVAPVFKTFNATNAQCAGGAVPIRSFTYIGQPFGYVTVPTALVTAINAAGGTTTNYRGALWKIASAAMPVTCTSPAVTNCATPPTGNGYNIVESYTSVGGQNFDSAQVGNPGLVPVTQFGAPVITPANGTGTVTMNATDILAYLRVSTAPPAPPVAPFGANISLNVTANDFSEAASPTAIAPGIIITSNGGATFNGGGPGMAFDGGVFPGFAAPAGSQMVYGQMTMTNANGSELLPLLVNVYTQYYYSAAVGFVNNTADNCTTLTAASVGQGDFVPNLAAGLTTASIAGGANNNFLKGQLAMKLSAPGANNHGALDLFINLGTTNAPNNCSPIVGAAATTGAKLTYLRDLQYCSAGSYNQDPRSRVTFGVYSLSPNSIYLRENY